MVNHFNGLFSHISDKKIYCILLIKMTWQMQGMCLRQLVSHFYISRSRIYLFLFIISVWCKHMWIRFWSYSHMFLFWYFCHLRIGSADYLASEADHVCALYIQASTFDRRLIKTALLRGNDGIRHKRKLFESHFREIQYDQWVTWGIFKTVFVPLNEVTREGIRVSF